MCTHMYTHTQAHSQIKNKKHSVVKNMSTQSLYMIFIVALIKIKTKETNMSVNRVVNLPWYVHILVLFYDKKNQAIKL